MSKEEMMNRYTDKKYSDNDLKKDSYVHTSVKELISESQKIRDSITKTLTYLNEIQSDQTLVS